MIFICPIGASKTSGSTDSFFLAPRMFPSRQTPQNINQVESTRVDDHLILLFLGAASLSPESSRLRRTTNPGTTALERGVNSEKDSKPHLEATQETDRARCQSSSPTPVPVTPPGMSAKGPFPSSARPASAAQGPCPGRDPSKGVGLSTEEREKPRGISRCSAPENHSKKAILGRMLLSSRGCVPL